MNAIDIGKNSVRVSFDATVDATLASNGDEGGSKKASDYLTPKQLRAIMDFDPNPILVLATLMAFNDKLDGERVANTKLPVGAWVTEKGEDGKIRQVWKETVLKFSESSFKRNLKQFQMKPVFLFHDNFFQPSGNRVGKIFEPFLADKGVQAVVHLMPGKEYTDDFRYDLATGGIETAGIRELSADIMFEVSKFNFETGVPKSFEVQSVDAVKKGQLQGSALESVLLEKKEEEKTTQSNQEVTIMNFDEAVRNLKASIDNDEQIDALINTFPSLRARLEADVAKAVVGLAKKEDVINSLSEEEIVNIALQNRDVVVEKLEESFSEEYKRQVELNVKVVKLISEKLGCSEDEATAIYAKTDISDEEGAEKLCQNFISMGIVKTVLGTSVLSKEEGKEVPVKKGLGDDIQPGL